MSVFRSLSLAALVLVAAACGDKVTVTNPSTPTPVVKTVTVAPATATLTVGQTLNLTAAVSADAGATYTVAWTTSDASKVSVNATTGAIKGEAVTPGVAICASAGGKQGCASIIVSAGGGTSPAVVSIASITVGNLNTPVAVPPGFVAGQMDVRINVTANSVSLDSVVLFVDNVSVAKQSFSAAQAAAMLTASEFAEQVGNTPVQIVISFNNSLCKLGTNLQVFCSFTNNNVSWLNSSTTGGNAHAISAKSFGKFAGTTPTASSSGSQSISLWFGNISGFLIKLTTTPGRTASPVTGETQKATFTDAAGYSWRSGAMLVEAVPLIYYLKADGLSQETVLNATVNFNSFGCSVGGLRTMPLANPVAPSLAWTGTFTNIPTGATGATAATNVGNYELNPAVGGCNAIMVSGGEIPVMAATGSVNNALFLGGGNGVLNGNTTSNFTNAPDFAVRLDNVAPAGVAVTLTPNGRTNNWLNDVVILNGFNTAAAPGLVPTASTSANGIITAGADLGSGRLIGTTTPVVFSARLGLAADANATVDGTAAVTSVSGVAESATNATYKLRIRAEDPIGNVSNNGPGNVGRDNTAPVLSFIGGSAANARLAAYSAGSYTFSVADPATPPAAPSGFFNLGATPLSVSQTRRNVAGITNWCPTTALYQSPAAACGGVAGWSLGGTNFPANLIVSELNGATVDAYYTIAATVFDQAGNVSAPATRVQVDDITPAALALLPPTSFVAGGASVFGGAMADNLDIQFLRINLVYVGLAPVLHDQATGVPWVGFTSAFGASAFWNPDVQVNGYDATPLIPASNIALSVNPTMTNVQRATGAAGVNPAAVGTALSNTFGFVFNQANTLAFATAPILAPTLPAATAMSNTGAGPVPGPAGGPQNWLMTNTAGTTAISMTGAGGLATSITLNASAQGVTGVFQNPFSAVQFWAYDATPLTEGWHLIATVNADATNDNGANRFWTFSTVWAPTAQSAPTTAACPGGTTYRVMAVGIGGTNLPAAQQGMALATPVSQRVVTVCP